MTSYNLFKIYNWNDKNEIQCMIEKIKLSSIDEGAKFALINNLNGYIIASDDSRFYNLVRKIQNNYNNIRRISKTGDIIKFFSRYEDCEHENFTAFKSFSQIHPEFVMNEDVVSTIKNSSFYESEKNNFDSNILISNLIIGNKYPRIFLSLAYGVSLERSATFTFKNDNDIAILIDQKTDINNSLDKKGNYWNEERTICEFGMITWKQPWYYDRIDKLNIMLSGKRKIFLFEKDAESHDYIFRGQFKCVDSIKFVKEDDHLIKAVLHRIDYKDVDSPENLVKDFMEIERNINLTRTQKDILVAARVGQGEYRENLLRKFNHKCPITQVNDLDKLLIASHIKPWAKCESNEERLDSENGILLSATYDKLFDQGYITFSDDGTLIVSRFISKESVEKLQIPVNKKIDIKISNKKIKYLNFHRNFIFKK